MGTFLRHNVVILCTRILVRATRSGLEFYEASAKDNINVTPIFERLVDLICDKMSKSLDANTTVLNNPQTKRLTAQPAGAGAGPGGLPSLQQCQQC